MDMLFSAPLLSDFLVLESKLNENVSTSPSVCGDVLSPCIFFLPSLDHVSDNHKRQFLLRFHFLES